MSENDGIIVRQTVVHTTVATWAEYAMWFTPFEEKGIIKYYVS